MVYHCVNPPYAKWADLHPPLMNAIIEGAAAAGARLVFGDNLYAYGPVDGPLTKTCPTWREGRTAGSGPRLPRRCCRLTRRAESERRSGEHPTSSAPMPISRALVTGLARGRQGRPLRCWGTPTFPYRDLHRGLRPSPGHTRRSRRGPGRGVARPGKAEAATMRSFVKMVFESAGNPFRLHGAALGDRNGRPVRSDDAGGQGAALSVRAAMGGRQHQVRADLRLDRYAVAGCRRRDGRLVPNSRAAPRESVRSQVLRLGRSRSESEGRSCQSFVITVVKTTDFRAGMGSSSITGVRMCGLRPTPVVCDHSRQDDRFQSWNGPPHHRDVRFGGAASGLSPQRHRVHAWKKRPWTTCGSQSLDQTWSGAHSGRGAVRGACSSKASPLALYRRYRPDTFAEVIGQEHVTEPLQRALTNNRVNHAYLLGPRGCGKTTSARILARALNCEKGPRAVPCGECQSCQDLARNGPGSIDVIEIDAASHGGRRRRTGFARAGVLCPGQQPLQDLHRRRGPHGDHGRLQCLAEAGRGAAAACQFVFATTEPDKVIGTIRSRTHHYLFRQVLPRLLTEYLAKLCEAEGIPVEPAVLPSWYAPVPARCATRSRCWTSYSAVPMNPRSIGRRLPCWDTHRLVAR